jgi:Tol biopolymer transport system component
MTIHGKDQKQLTDKPSAWPRVSPDGKFIVYTGPDDDSNERLMVMPFEGGEPVMIFPVPQNALSGRRSIQWSPDAKAILYKDASHGLWRQSLNEERPQPVRGFEELTLRQLAWSFDGKKLAYTTGTTSQEIILIENLQ